MNSDVQNDFDRVDETLASLSESAKSLAVETGTTGGDLGARMHTLQKALEGVRADVQDLRSELEG
jgi:methyl-accepting chemotaxis protein